VIVKWEYKGQKLNPLYVIVLRLLMWPFLQFSRCLMFAVVFIGWGRGDAKRVWDDTE
jgi:hypothetical protein